IYEPNPESIARSLVDIEFDESNGSVEPSVLTSELIFPKFC
ncbi:25376_t:CDS:2, partial [Gigaspora rosea]